MGRSLLYAFQSSNRPEVSLSLPSRPDLEDSPHTLVGDLEFTGRLESDAREGVRPGPSLRRRVPAHLQLVRRHVLDSGTMTSCTPIEGLLEAMQAYALEIVAYVAEGQATYNPFLMHEILHKIHGAADGLEKNALFVIGKMQEEAKPVPVVDPVPSELFPLPEELEALADVPPSPEYTPFWQICEDNGMDYNSDQSRGV